MKASNIRESGSLGNLHKKAMSGCFVGVWGDLNKYPVTIGSII